jgi:replicative DNA helicase
MQTLTSKQLAKDWQVYQHKRHNNPDLYGLKSTGIAVLDEVLEGGLELTQMAVIGGAEKSGKTTLMLNICNQFNRQGLNTIWFGAEMNNMQVGSMLFAKLSGIERTKIRRINLDVQDFEVLKKAGEKIEAYPGYWNYGFSTLTDVMKEITRIEKESGVKIDAIFVDYIQLMEEETGKGPRSEQLEKISRNLKRLTNCLPHPMGVIVASQLNRETLRMKLVDAHGFLGTGSLERDMDIGMIIHPYKDEITGKESDNKKEIVIVGSRETKKSSCVVGYNGATAQIFDPPSTNMPEVVIGDYW